jgi:hypothetical protein
MINAIEWFKEKGFTFDDKITIKDIIDLQEDAQKELQSQLTTLEAACAEKDEALRVATVNLVCLKNNMATGDWDAITKCIDSALSSTSGQRILEENRRLSENFDALKKHYIKTIHAIRLTFGQDYGHAMNCDCDRCFDLLAADRFIQSLSTNQLNQRK